VGAKVQHVLGVPWASLGSLSETGTVFDSDAMLAIIGELADQFGPVGHDARLRDVDQVLTLVDGSWMRALLVTDGLGIVPGLPTPGRQARWSATANPLLAPVVQSNVQAQTRGQISATTGICPRDLVRLHGRTTLCHNHTVTHWHSAP